ncbi:MAG: hypothetical protein HYR94_04565 [Chloroflexi bacterium]|nr:hypothetical protein [Chloroflexota bacterium]
MSDTNGRPKDSEVQATQGPPDPELESLIAPQGYSPELVDEVATMQTPAQQRRAAIRFMIVSIILIAIGFWFCTPANLVIPTGLNDPAPYGIDDRPTPPTNKFLEDAMPRAIGQFKLVDLKKEQVFEDPFVGADVVRGTYLDEIGNPASVIMIQADSYINARRYLENYKNLLQERAAIIEWKERLYIEDNYIQWSAPGFADRAYGLAWNNDRYFIAVTSPISATQQALAEAFPY